MEFAVVLGLLAAFLGMGLLIKRYTVRVRLAILLLAAVAPAWYFIIWRAT